MKKRILATILLTIYASFLLKILIFKDLPLVRIGHLKLNFGGTHEGHPNFIPFKTILPYILGENGFLIAVINIVGNIVLLIPIGFLALLAFPKLNWKQNIMLALAAGFIVEGLQAIFHVGIFDIDDVILNGFGVVIGYWAATIFLTLTHSIKNYLAISISSIIGVLLIIFVVAAIIKLPLPIGIEKNEEINFFKNHRDKKNDSSACCDLCNGTGGTGQIVSLGNSSITIKAKNGLIQVIKISNQTIVRASSGPITIVDLKVGESVTVIINESETASTILVCNEPI